MREIRWFRALQKREEGFFLFIHLFLQERDNGFFSFVNLWKRLVEYEEAPGFLRPYDILEGILEKRIIPLGCGMMKRGIDEQGRQEQR